MAVGTGLLPLGPDDAHRVAFAPVVPSGITAVADVIPGTDGTQIKVECVYAEVNDPRPAAVMRPIRSSCRPGGSRLGDQGMARDAEQADAPEWHDLLRVSQIADLEIRESDTNEVLLRANLR